MLILRFITILLTISLALTCEVLTLRESKCDWHLYSEAVHWPLNSVALYSRCHIPCTEISVKIGKLPTMPTWLTRIPEPRGKMYFLENIVSHGGNQLPVVKL